MGGRSKSSTFSSYCPKFGHGRNADRSVDNEIDRWKQWPSRIRTLKQQWSEVGVAEFKVQGPPRSPRNMWCPKFGHVRVQSPSTSTKSKLWGKSWTEVQVQSSKVNQSEGVILTNQIRAWAFGQYINPRVRELVRSWGWWLGVITWRSDLGIALLETIKLLQEIKVSRTSFAFVVFLCILIYL